MTIRPSLAALTASLALLVPLANECASQPTADRQGPAGTQPDNYQDAQHVTIYRNADLVPNVATFCVGQYGFIVTLKTGSSSGADTSPALVRFPELDKRCAS